MKYYAVRAGHLPGIYTYQDEVREQIAGYWPRGEWKGFDKEEDAKEYLRKPIYSYDSDSEEEDDYVDQHAIECGCKGGMFYLHHNLIFDDKRSWQKYTGAGCEGFTCLKEAKMSSRYDNPHLPVVERFREDLKSVGQDGEEVYDVYTDGSLLGGTAGIGVYFGENNPDNVAEQFGDVGETSQRAELAAIKAALTVIAERNSGDKYAIHTDSEYSLNCLAEWYKAWELNGWKTANGEVVANQDLIKAILKLMGSSPCAGKVKMCKVQAHGSSYGNNMADKYARERRFF